MNAPGWKSILEQRMQRKRQRSKLIRWKYVLPRLAVILLVGLVIRFALDPMIKWAITSGGQSALGAKVEIASLRTSLWDGKLKLGGLAIANPQSPMHNLLEASDSKLQLDVNALLHGRVVVTDGLVSGLQFDTDRETSGALEITDSEPTTGSTMFDPLLASAEEMGDAWFDQLSERLDTNIADQLQSPRVAKQLRDQWPKQYRELQAKVASIRERGKELEQSFRIVKANPLRGLQQLPKLQQDLTDLQQEVKTVQQQIGKLPQQAKADRQAVLEARKQDEALLRQKLQIGSLDGEGLTQTLLGEPVTQGLATTLEWVRWARDQVPANPAKNKEKRSRGTTVIFTPPQPDYLVKRLRFEADARLSGQPLQLTGTLTDATNAPKLLGEPTRLILQGSDALALHAEIVLDRRGEIATDTLHLTCPRLAMSGRTLGKPQKLAIEVGSGYADFQVDLKICDERIEGEIFFAQESLELTPRVAKAPEGKMATALSQALAGVQRLEASISLAGTLQKPKLKIKSDIGNQVAAGLNATVRRVVQQQADRLLADSRARVDEQLQGLTEIRERAQSELLGQLGQGKELLGQIAALSGGDGNGLGGVPQLGKSLRIGDLLKK